MLLDRNQDDRDGMSCLLRTCEVLETCHGCDNKFCAAHGSRWQYGGITLFLCSQCLRKPKYSFAKVIGPALAPEEFIG